MHSTREKRRKQALHTRPHISKLPMVYRRALQEQHEESSNLTHVNIQENISNREAEYESIDDENIEEEEGLQNLI